MIGNVVGNEISRRSLLRHTGAGFGAVALAGMLSKTARAQQPKESGLLHAKPPHFNAKAKRIIFVFLEGAMSSLDTWEYKPVLQQSDGKVGAGGGTLVSSKFKFQQYGETGTWVSELFPHAAHHVDKLCFLRGLHTDTPAHPQAVIQLHTGAANATLVRPSMGAWVVYGLGTQNEELPGFVTINPPPNFGGAINYGSAFLPAHYQGTKISDTGFLPNLKPSIETKVQRQQIDLLQALHREQAKTPTAPDTLEGIIQSYEQAFTMQQKVPDLLDLKSEPQHILDLYGVKEGPEGSFARQCLMARRLSEAGVRFVEICDPGWDHHNNLHNGLINRCRSVDQPVAALLQDLEQRGLLEDTLVLFGSEFGRLPHAQGPDGRDHNITGYMMWLAGAGVKPGYSFGATDELGRHAVDGKMHTTDLHATILALMGLDHESLTYPYSGREFRITDVSGKVAKEIFA
ncbi:MAG: DUF1501 domain-containing protein [Pirellula sp.]